MNNPSIEVQIYYDLAELYSENLKWQKGYNALLKHIELENIVRGAEVSRKAQEFEHSKRIAQIEKEQAIKQAISDEQERILHKILPASIAKRLVGGAATIADYYDEVSIFFLDLVGFTTLSSKLSADELVDLLNEFFKKIDEIAQNRGIEKIKTIGDAYMAASGIPVKKKDHAESMALFALDVREMISNFDSKGNGIEARIGIHCGPVTAGVIGDSKFFFDVWGDTVNIAARLEGSSEPNHIHISEEFASSLNEKFQLNKRSPIELKGKGKVQTYYLIQI